LPDLEQKEPEQLITSPDIDLYEDVTRDQTQDDEPSQVVSVTASLAEQNLQHIMGKIEEERNAQMELAEKIEKLKEQQEEIQRQKRMQESTAHGDKLMLMDRRNMLPSAVNYATHCDFSFS
jgi:hypothetical protein